MENKDNIIFIGDKPLMNYVTALIIQVKKTDTFVVKARGRFIKKAVDAVEIFKKKFLSGKKMETKIKTDTEKFKSDGRDLSVSTIEITVILK